jgi:magnesium chelatase subunit I
MLGITGKLELEYEGELRGADTVVHDLIRIAVGKIYDRYFSGEDTQQIEQWFNLGGTVKLDDSQPAHVQVGELKQIQGLLDNLGAVDVKKSDAPGKVVAAAEFMLEGMVAHRKLSRSEERGFGAEEKATRGRERERAEPESEHEDWQQARRSRKGGYN